jgi:hypothetical protein
MADAINSDFPPLIIDQIHDTIVALANPVAIVVACELLGAGWPWILRQRMNSLNNAHPVALSTDRLQFLPGRGLY